MGVLNIVLILAGLAAMVAGYARARGPWARYQALKAQEANIARYESWRGGLRDTGTTGASVAMDMARRDARNGAIIVAAGLAIAILGFLVH
ncbi:MAG TPA: hypothetical protein VHR16_04545 [Candidatus Limnocylindrales bacterium]|jgi:hypothetical protein|nr:hypothetical protein [Candidatus Limnocylindrales bacterium]